MTRKQRWEHINNDDLTYDPDLLANLNRRHSWESQRNLTWWQWFKIFVLCAAPGWLLLVLMVYR